MARLEHLVAAFAALLFGCLVPSVGSAQNITTDGTLEAKLTLAGPSYPITADLGKRGGSMSRSPGVFCLNNGESATFSGPATVTNASERHQHRERPLRHSGFGHRIGQTISLLAGSFIASMHLGD